MYCNEVVLGREVHQESEVGHRYERGATALVTMAKEVFGLEVPPAAMELWRNIFVGMYYLDDIVDSNKPKAERWKDFDRALGYLKTGESDISGFPSQTAEALRDLHTSLSYLGETKVQTFITTGRKVAELSEQLRVTKSAQDMGRLAITEGQLTSKLFIVDSPLQPTEKFDAYQKWLEILGGASNLVDAILDLKADAAAGRVGFTPTYRDYGVLLTQVGVESIRLVKGLNYRGFKGLLKLIPVTFTDRAR